MKIANIYERRAKNFCLGYCSTTLELENRLQKAANFLQELITSIDVPDYIQEEADDLCKLLVNGESNE